MEKSGQCGYSKEIRDWQLGETSPWSIDRLDPPGSVLLQGSVRKIKETDGIHSSTLMSILINVNFAVGAQTVKR